MVPRWSPTRTRSRSLRTLVTDDAVPNPFANDERLQQLYDTERRLQERASGFRSRIEEMKRALRAYDGYVDAAAEQQARLSAVDLIARGHGDDSGRYRDRNQDSVRRIPRNGPTVSPQPANDSTRTHATAGFMNAMILPERNEHALPVHSSGRAFAGDDHAIIPLSTRLLDRFSPHATRESPLPPSRPPKRRQSRWQRTWYRALSCRIEGSRVSGCRTNRRRPQ
jgi:hypothetical protein